MGSNDIPFLKIADKGRDNLAIGTSYDFTVASDHSENFLLPIAQGKINGIRSVFIDNSANGNPLTITCAGLLVKLICPANAQMWSPVIVWNPPVFTVSSSGTGTAGKATIAWLNFDVQPAIMTPNASGGGSVYSGTPKFSYTMAGDVNLGNLAITVGAFNTIIFDDTNAFNTATQQFNPQTAGIYWIQLKVVILASVANAMTQALAYVGLNAANNQALAQNISGITATLWSITAQGFVIMNGKTDYIVPQALSNASSGNLAWKGGLDSYFGGYYIGPVT